MKNTTFVSAGAGSGKTYRLTQEIARMITKEECRAEEIILTTFTESAAKELREKVRSKLYSEGLYEAAMNIDNAAIGTIHSIAYQFVSRYWYLLGISANVTIMDNEGSKLCISQSLASLPSEEDLRLFENILTSFNVTKNVNNVSKLDPDFWKEELKKIIDKTIELCLGEKELEEARKESKALLKDLFDWSGKNISGKKVDAASKEELDAALKKEIDTALKYANESFNVTGNNKTKASIEKNINIVQSFDEKCIHLHGLYTLASLIKSDSKTKKQYPDIVAFFEKMYKSLPASDQVRDLIERYIDTIFRLAIKWKKDYEEFKRKRCLLDFGDLLQKFYELLQKEEVVEDIKSRYKVALVDEFQDCSPLQVKSFERLSELMERSVWVGDIKQAIYGFRGTNTELVKSIIDKANLETDGNKCYPLENCWRSNETIVNLVNNVFCEKVFKDQLEEKLIKLGIPARTESDPPAPQERELRHVHLDAKNLDGSYKLIADLVAEQIDNGTFKPNEIAILCRYNSDVRTCAKALKERGIAYNARFDSDAYNEENGVDEVASFINAVVSFAAREDNELSKAIIANRIEAGCSIPKLIADRMQNIESEAKGKNWLSDLHIVGRIANIRKAIGNQSVTAAVETLIVELNLADLIKRIDPKAPAYNYCSALEAKAATYEGMRAGFGLSSTLVGFVQYLKEHPIEYPGDDNGVSVMTYHKSKGLEWRCVLLCSLYKAPVVFDKTHFGVLTCNKKADTDTQLRLVPALLTSLCGGIETRFMENDFFSAIRAAAVNEAKRLMYVGMTRPKEQLILTTFKPNGKEGKNDPAQWLLDIGCDKIDTLSKDSIIKWGDAEWIHSVISSNVDEHEDTPAEAVEFNVIKQPEERSSFDVKFVSPSKARTEEQPYVAEQYANFAQRIALKSEDGSDSIIGDFIHHVMCLWNGDKGIIETLAKAYGVVADVDAVSTSIAGFWKWMEDTYGPATLVERELPFSFVNENGQVVTGEIDLVYRTENGDVLVDYKTYQGSASHLTDESSKFHAGKKYGGQIALYEEALKRRESVVRDRLICYLSLVVIIKMK